MVHKNFFFSVGPAPRSWSWGSPHRGRATSQQCRESSGPFVRPCHTKENISLDLRNWGLLTYQAPRRIMTMMRGTTLQSADILNPYRRFKFKLFTLTKTVAELNFWTTAWTAFCSSSCLPLAKLWQTCRRKECKWWHRMSVITDEWWNNALNVYDGNQSQEPL